MISFLKMRQTGENLIKNWARTFAEKKDQRWWDRINLVKWLKFKKGFKEESFVKALDPRQNSPQLVSRAEKRTSCGANNEDLATFESKHSVTNLIFYDDWLILHVFIPCFERCFCRPACVEIFIIWCHGTSLEKLELKHVTCKHESSLQIRQFSIRATFDRIHSFVDAQNPSGEPFDLGQWFKS